MATTVRSRLHPFRWTRKQKTDDVQGIHHGTALRCLWSQVLFGFRSLEWLGPPCYIWQDRWSWTRSWQSRRWNEDPRTDVVSSWVVAPSWGVFFNKRRYSKEKSTLHVIIYIYIYYVSVRQFQWFWSRTTSWANKKYAGTQAEAIALSGGVKGGGFDSSSFSSKPPWFSTWRGTLCLWISCWNRSSLQPRHCSAHLCPGVLQRAILQSMPSWYLLLFLLPLLPSLPSKLRLEIKRRWWPGSRLFFCLKPNKQNCWVSIWRDLILVS